MDVLMAGTWGWWVRVACKNQEQTVRSVLGPAVEFTCVSGPVQAESARGPLAQHTEERQ
jgi:hypothetical protein